MHASLIVLHKKERIEKERERKCKEKFVTKIDKGKKYRRVSGICQWEISK